MTETSRPLPELWGGIECTVNRVGDRYLDQIALTGHDGRLSDLDRFRDLGLTVLRYPVLWERTCPDSPDRFHWEWADERLGRLRELGIDPIVGLVHHGSGPRYTDLLDPEFPEKLAAYAGRVAERYPWVSRFTPVNEPLTTSRFSGLYGHWYPHRRDDRAFGRMLWNQCRATVLAMEAIRRTRPDALLVQTEDLGTVYGSPGLRDQAAFENERRWLTWDLLCGRVDAAHPLRRFLVRCGLTEGELESLRERACPPDRIGVNHYVTSSRYLDENVDRYPPSRRGGNGRQVYADVEAVRAAGVEVQPLSSLLEEAWARYRIPVAVTEAHLGCTREEQLRWLDEVWREAGLARLRGAGVVAVTAWSLLGAFDWDSLVTLCRGHYEPGAFDVRSTPPRPTALAQLLRDLRRGTSPPHPVLLNPGWWKRPERILYGDPPAAVAPGERSAPILITGGTGTLGRALAQLCAKRGIAFRLLSRRDLDIADAEAVRRILRESGCWAVLNAAGYVRVDEAERDRERCYRENVLGAVALAQACADTGVRLATFSSDLVFDGRTTVPYGESSPVGPLNVYGHTKAEAERLVLEICPDALVIRTSAFFGPWDEANFVTVTLKRLRTGQPVVAAEDLVVSPTYVPDLADACLDLLVDGERGIRHLANRGAVSWAELARMAARATGLDPGLVEGRPAQSLVRAARPPYSALRSEHGDLLGPLERGLERYLTTGETA